MGNSLEIDRDAWLETCRKQMETAFVTEVRKIVNSPDYWYGAYIPEFYEWCMEYYKKFVLHISPDATYAPRKAK